MSSSNLWHVKKFDDLLHWIKQSTNKSIFLGITLDNSKPIKKFLKKKSENYKNSYFLYWTAQENELSRMSVLPTDKTKYPYAVCINNINDLLCEVNNVEDENTLEMCFEQVKKFFDLDNSNNMISMNITNTIKQIDKINVIKKKSEDYQIDFFKDIQKRKKDEEKNQKNKS
jgi:hypothetical protein